MRQAALALLLAVPAAAAKPKRPQVPAPEPVLVEQTGHALSVDAVALSADGRLAATAGKDGKAALWDARTGHKLRTFSVDGLGASAVALSADGTRLAASGAGVVTLWDSATGQVLKKLGRPGEFLTRLILSGADTLVTAGNDHAARLWSLSTGKLQREFPVPAGRAVDAALQGGRLAVLASGGEVLLFEADKDAPFKTLESGGPATRVAWSRDSALVAAGGEEGVWVWDARTGKPKGSFKTPAHRGLEFSRDGRTLFTCGGANTVRQWTLDGDAVRSFIGHLDAVRALVMGENGQLLTGSDDRSARLWDARSGKELRRFAAAPSPILEALVSADGRRLVTIESQAARLWDVESGALVRVTTGDFTSSSGLTLSATGRLLASVRERELVDLKDLEAGRDHGTFQWNLLRAASVALAADASFLATANDQRIQLWDPATMDERHGAPSPKRRVNRLWTALGGRRLLYLDDFGALHLWDPATARERASWPARGAAPPDVTLSCDGAFAATAEGAGTRAVFSVRSMDDGSLLSGWDADANASPYAFAPGGRQLLIRAGHGVWDWDVSSQRPLHAWEPPDGLELKWPRAVDPRWHWLVADDAGRAVFLSLNKGKELGRLWATERGWLLRAQDGRLDGSDDALRWTVGLVSHPLDRYPGARRERGLLGRLLRPAP
jgi:WD40 repeat protein